MKCVKVESSDTKHRVVISKTIVHFPCEGYQDIQLSHELKLIGQHRYGQNIGAYHVAQ